MFLRAPHFRYALCALLALGAGTPGFSVEPGAPDLPALATDIAEGRYPGIEAVVVSRRGKILADATTVNLAAEGLDIRSATKSITSLLVGIALDRGQLASLEQPIVELLPEYAKQLKSDPRKARIRLVDLLTMRSGLDCNDWDKSSPGHGDKMYRRRDWLAFWAKAPMREEPGTHYSYCTGNMVALGRILKNATGKDVATFARESLFAPLGIENAKWATWNSGRDIDSGGHLQIHPRDLLEIGKLLLNQGRAGEREIISRAYLEAMTSPKTPVPGMKQQYGYGWWLDTTSNPDLPKTRLQMAWGNGGNYLVVLPELDAVVVFAGKRYNQENAVEPLFLLRDRILPVLAAE